MNYVETTYGFWNPIVFIFFLCIAIIIAVVLIIFGRKDFTYSKEKAKPFASGEDPFAYYGIKASDYFWGFFKATEKYYKILLNLHGGIINEYIFWFIVVVSSLLLFLFLGVCI
ncbi:MAG: hypothetical protein QXM75_03865 [Candidatus Diapherotrites archaeon]